jgi:hypothetical protein
VKCCSSATPALEVGVVSPATSRRLMVVVFLTVQSLLVEDCPIDPYRCHQASPAWRRLNSVGGIEGHRCEIPISRDHSYRMRAGRGGFSRNLSKSSVSSEGCGLQPVHKPSRINVGFNP